eukprot:COSAG04_NODE_3255_length_3004_cov_2.042341_4_plen_77_part_00
MLKAFADKVFNFGSTSEETFGLDGAELAEVIAVMDPKPKHGHGLGALSPQNFKLLTEAAAVSADVCKVLPELQEGD